MKKAKTMLVTLVFVAFVGATLAFKAKDFSTDKVYTTNAAGAPGVNTKTSWTLAFIPGASVEITFATTILNAPAPQQNIYFSGN